MDRSGAEVESERKPYSKLLNSASAYKFSMKAKHYSLLLEFNCLHAIPASFSHAMSSTIVAKFYLLEFSDHV